MIFNLKRICLCSVFAAFALFVSFSSQYTVFAASGPAYVGLTAHLNKAAVPISSQTIDICFNYGDAPSATFSSPSGFSVSLLSAAYTESGSYVSYGEALAAGGGIPAHNGAYWTVYKEGGAAVNCIVIKSGNTAVAAFSANVPPLVRGTGGITVIGEKSYRGYIKPISVSNGISLINVVDLEDYLCGVVPSEMPALWPAEALKAQAVAARTYYLFSKGIVHPDTGYEVCDAIHCQVYNGVSAEHVNTTAAVLQTQGVAIYYNNKPINAVFSASTGGYTENSENVWLEALPYLRSVKEIAEKEYATWSKTYTFSQIREGLAANGHNIGDITSVTVVYSSTGRVYSITFNGTNGSYKYEKDAVRSFSNKIDSSLLSSVFTVNGYGGAEQTQSQPGASSQTQLLPVPSGTIYVIGSNGVKTVSPAGLHIVSELKSAIAGNEFTAISGDKNIKSYTTQASASADYTPSATATGASYTISTPSLVLQGKGSGHGVGMSQYGAKGMAEEGFTYEQILKHYYTGVDIR